MTPCDECGRLLAPAPGLCQECETRFGLELEADMYAEGGAFSIERVPEAQPRSPYLIPPNPRAVTELGEMLFMRRLRESGL